MRNCADTRKSPEPVVVGPGEGKKFDEGKQPWYAMPLEVLEPLADVFAAGEKKYDTFNCLEPFKDGSRRFYDGLMRHLSKAQRDPLAIDPELKKKYDVEVFHLAQVAFNALMLLHHALRESAENFDREIQNEDHSG